MIGESGWRRGVLRKFGGGCFCEDLDMGIEAEARMDYWV